MEAYKRFEAPWVHKNNAENVPTDYPGFKQQSFLK
jgi:hypothetical protein